MDGKVDCTYSYLLLSFKWLTHVSEFSIRNDNWKKVQNISSYLLMMWRFSLLSDDNVPSNLFYKLITVVKPKRLSSTEHKLLRRRSAVSGERHDDVTHIPFNCLLSNPLFLETDVTSYMHAYILLTILEVSTAGSQHPVTIIAKQITHIEISDVNRFREDVSLGKSTCNRQ
jgi:hypothetical protein